MPGMIEVEGGTGSQVMVEICRHCVLLLEI